MNHNCFAYRNGKCVILSEAICKNGPCHFFATPKEVREARSDAKHKLAEKGLIPVVKSKEGVRIQSVRKK